MLNQIVLVGRITDIRIEEIDDDKKVAFLKLSVPRPYKNSQGEYDTDVVPVIIYGGIADNVANYCNKGDLVGAKGRVESDDEGIKIIAEKVTFLSSKAEESEEN